MWEKIAMENLGVKTGERIVVLSDCERSLPLPAEIVVGPSTGGHGREPHIDVWNEVFGAAAVAALDMRGVFSRILDKTMNADDEAILRELAPGFSKLVPAAVISITHFSTSHTAFRRILCAAGSRYASMPLFEDDLLRENGPLDVDNPRLIARTRALVRRLEGAREIRVTTPDGTDLSFSVQGRPFIADDGDLAAPGAFGNLPAGEVYCAPVEGTGRGRVVIGSDLALLVENGSVTGIEGSGADRTGIRRVFAENPEYLKLAELGIGTNDRASRQDNVLEAEKILGTVHIAFGDNAGFGGTQKIPYHVDHVQYRPELVVDGRKMELAAS